MVHEYKTLEELEAKRAARAVSYTHLGLPVIRAFSTEKYEEKRFDGANRDLTKTNLFVNRAMTFMMPMICLLYTSRCV